MATEFKIDKDIAPPIERGRTKYPFREMEIGDSILFPEDVSERARNASICIRRTTPTLRFSSRKEEGGLRIWRVA